MRRGVALHDLGVIEDGSVLIRDGVIAAVGTTRRVENLKAARNAIEIPVSGGIVTPGFVDASFNLGVAPDTGSPQFSKKRKKAGEFHAETLSLLRSCLQYGTLTTEVKAYVDGLDLRSRFPLFRQLARISDNPVRLVRTCRISRLPSTDDRASKRLIEAITALARRRMVQYVELNAEPESAVGSAALLRAAELTNLRFKLLWRGGSPDTLADMMSRFNPLTVCCPCHLSSEELPHLSTASSITVFSPSQEVFETSTPKCARETVDLGGAIALSTGYDVTYAPTFQYADGVGSRRTTPATHARRGNHRGDNQCGVRHGIWRFCR